MIVFGNGNVKKMWGWFRSEVQHVQRQAEGIAGVGVCVGDVVGIGGGGIGGNMGRFGGGGRNGVTEWNRQWSSRLLMDVDDKRDDGGGAVGDEFGTAGVGVGVGVGGKGGKEWPKKEYSRNMWDLMETNDAAKRAQWGKELQESGVEDDDEEDDDANTDNDFYIVIYNFKILLR